MRRLAVAVALVAATLSAAAPARADATATVRVDANAFAPFETAVDAHGTVTWLVQEGGHTIAADDGRFQFRGSGSTTLPPGSTVSFAFGVDELVPYYCEIHGGPGGQGMAGRVRVGNPAGPAPHEQPVIRVPGDAPTLALALALAAPGHRIELGPGDHSIVEPAHVAVDNLTVAGTDDTTRLVPRAGPRGFPEAALRITASHVRIEKLRIGAFRASGIQLDSADAAEIVDVHVDGGKFTLDGILATSVTGATIRASTTVGNRRAGIRIADCAACGALVDGVRSSDNATGVLVESASGVVVRRSTIERNSTGILGRAVRSTSPLRPVVVTILDNVLSDARLSGASDSVIARNNVSGAIAVAGDVSQRTTVNNNIVGGALVWDGAGVAVTFADNQTPSGAPKPVTLDPTASLR